MSLGGAEARMPLRLAVQEIADQVFIAYNIDEATLRSPSQQVALESRELVGWLVRELGCVNISEVGKHVNLDVGSISSSVRCLSDLMRAVEALANRVHLLKNAFVEQT